MLKKSDTQTAYLFCTFHKLSYLVLTLNGSDFIQIMFQCLFTYKKGQKAITVDVTYGGKYFVSGSRFGSYTLKLLVSTS